MMWPLWAVNAHLRYGTKPLMGALRNLRTVGVIADLYAQLVFKTRRDMVFEPDVLTGGTRAVPCLWCSAGPARTDRIMLYLHGGGFTIGGAVSHKAMVARIAGAAGLRAAMVLYRRAPEAPYPAAIDDAEMAYRALLSRGYTGRDIVLAGDSAGGGLVFSLLLRIQAHGLAQPCACVALSPLGDLSRSGASYRENTRSDTMLPLAWIIRTGAAYLGKSDPQDPDLSPVFGKFAAPPDSYIAYATDELLASDSVALADGLRAGGGTVKLIAKSGLPHVWTLYQGRLSEAEDTIADIADFIQSRFSKEA